MPNPNVPVEIRAAHFFSKAREIHGDRYSYTTARYVNKRSEITITCPVHGNFQQTPWTHLNGMGCRRCTLRRPTTEEFIAKAEAIHGKRYSYSKAKYINRRSTILITCPRHGDFLQSAHNHLEGHGCVSCSRDISTTAEYISKAREVHGHKYCYDCVEYKTLRHSVEIVCPTHGPFKQKARRHIEGGGCRRCKRARKTTLQFIARAQEVHGNKYGYDHTNFTNCRDYVSIVCPIHGIFRQKACNHLAGHGCQQCGRHAGAYSHNRFKHDPELASKPGEVYVVKLVHGGTTVIKIGITARSVHERAENWQVPFSVLLTREGALQQVFEVEQLALRLFRRYRAYPTWLPNGRTECFRIEALLELCEYVDDAFDPSVD